MGWLDKLKGLFKVNINAPLINVNITSKSNNIIKTKYSYDSEKKALDIFLNELEPEETKELDKIMPQIIEEYLQEENLLLLNESKDLLEKLYNYNKNTTDKQILTFFKPLIPESDIEALECSLYLRDAFRRGEDIGKLKTDIRLKFGERGKNIANLCTAGYFEEFLIPLYNSSSERFQELYDLIVSKSILAVFVHKNMSTQEIKDEISEKLALSNRYGIKFIHIHGIGKNNITTIKDCLEEQKDFFNYFEKKVYEQDNILIIELLLSK